MGRREHAEGHCWPNSAGSQLTANHFSAHTHTRTHPYSFSKNTHTLPSSSTHTVKLTFTHTHFLSLSHTHTHTYTHTHIHTHTYTYAYTQGDDGINIHSNFLDIISIPPGLPGHIATVCLRQQGACPPILGGNVNHYLAVGSKVQLLSRATLRQVDKYFLILFLKL